MRNFKMKQDVFTRLGCLLNLKILTNGAAEMQRMRTQEQRDKNEIAMEPTYNPFLSIFGSVFPKLYSAQMR